MFVRILFSVSMILSTETKIHSASTEVTLVAGSMIGVSVFLSFFLPFAAWVRFSIRSSVSFCS
jgi:hypothetical protein